MKIKAIPVGIYGANCYILMDENTKETAIIDPGGDGELLIKVIKEMECNVKYILLTHGHIDHTGAVEELKNKFNVPVYMNEKDQQMILKGENIYGRIKADKYIKEGDIFNIGDIDIKCIETPGHTPGGVSFIANNVIFTGDTLFAGSIGRTDFAGGDFNTIIKSIKEKIIILPEDFVVLSGHGPKSSVLEEKLNNPFL